MTPSRDLVSHPIQQHSTIPYTKPYSSIMRYLSNSPTALQLLSIGATMDMRPSSTNKQSTLVKAVVVADQ